MARRYDIIIIGGGHAGAEAAWAAARLGARTAMVTFTRDAIGRMSCNPAIGGIGKGQMVRELDALGGLMGQVADETGIQFRMLNRRKGPAVWSPRCQSDSRLYALAVQRRLSECANLEIIEASVEGLLSEPLRDAAYGVDDAQSGDQYSIPTPQASIGERTRVTEYRDPCHPGDKVRDDVRLDCGGAALQITGVRLGDGTALRADAVVVTSGTFLGALMHCGECQTPGGRVGEAAAMGLSAALRDLGIRLGRLKTGTPPRVARDSVRFDELEVQEGDDPPAPFSFLTPRIEQPQVCCWITYTNPAVHDLLRANLHRAPMYSGQIYSRGPRYCPSVEDKIVRFGDKQQHQIFLEPEGRDSDRVYCNGISTSTPQDVQTQMLRLIPGLEDARVLQWGYAVEYDFAPPEQLLPTLMTKRVRGLFLAGQICGTSGYEEAAGQGLVAGVNAAHYVARRPAFVLGRDEAYIGVMVDDLVTRGVTEPYRMFSSRAEHRLHLRYDNADRRLTPMARTIGLVDDDRWRQFERRSAEFAALGEMIRVARWEGKTIAEWLRRPDTDPEGLLARCPALAAAAPAADIWASAVIAVRYAGYIERQDRSIEEFRSLEAQKLPEGLKYAQIPNLRREAVEQWSLVRPASVGQAARVSGIHPTDVSMLIVYLSSQSRVGENSRN